MVTQPNSLGLVSASHAYNSSGVYNATLTILDGADDTVSTTIPFTAVVSSSTVEDGVLHLIGTRDDDDVSVDTVNGVIRVQASFEEDLLFAEPIDSILIKTFEGNDRVTISDDVDLSVKIDGGAGSDRIRGGGGDDQLEGGAGRDLLIGAGGKDVLQGGDGNDLLDGGDSHDRLNGQNGDDLVRGGGGHDLLIGGLGNDILLGGRDNDRMHGDFGYNLMIGGLGFDVLKGGQGENILIGGATDHDNHDQALQAIIQEWTYAPRPFLLRVFNLTSGNGSPSPFNMDTYLTAGGTVHDDGRQDWLVGGPSRDWFFQSRHLDLLTGVVFGWDWISEQ